MTKTPFLQELAEARMFRHSSDLTGKKASDIARIVYMMLIILEIYRYDNPSAAKDYVKKTLALGDFKVVSSAATDLYNLLTILLHQKDFAERIETDYAISLPFLQTKRYLRAVIDQRPVDSHSLDRMFFFKLEDYLRINGAEMRVLRRAILDWKDTGLNERKTVFQILKRTFMRDAYYVDLFYSSFNSFSAKPPDLD